jgi:hypothetical protein
LVLLGPISAYSCPIFPPQTDIADPHAHGLNVVRDTKSSRSAQGTDYSSQQTGNKTHQSTTDSEAMLCRKAKGKEARMGYAGHLLMENRNDLAVSACVTAATGTAEREEAPGLR